MKKKTSVQNIKKPFTSEFYDQAIFASMVYNDPEMTQWIMERKEDMDAHIHHMNTGDGSTLLQVAASRGYLCLVKILLESGFSTNDKPALHYAVAHRRFDVVELLIDHGANLNARSYNAKTPVFAAIIGQNHESLLFLAQKGANLEHRSNGYTPLLLAAINKDHKAISILLSFGVEVNATDVIWEKNTALHTASKNGDVMSVQKLLDAGANVSIRNRKGEKPFFSAIYNHHPDIVMMFLSRGMVTQEDCMEIRHKSDQRIEKVLEMIHEYMKNKELESEPSGLSF